MSTFPPPGFIPTDSTVDGITVFMPALEQVEHHEIVAFSCPQCGGVQAYSIAEGGLTCTHCGYHKPPENEVVGRAAESFEFTVETMERVAHGWGRERKDLVCQSCGARTSIEPEALTHTCPFCGSNNVIQREAPQDELRPRFIAPFAIDAPECGSILHEWLGSSWLVPGDLKKLARRQMFTAIYLPFWTFDASAQASWRAEVRKKRKRGGKTQHYWRWESGNTGRVFDDLLAPGAEHVSTRLLKEIAPFRLQALTPYEPIYLAGLSAQANVTPLDQAWESARHRMREQVRDDCRSQASSSRIRNFSMNLAYENESWRYILLPVYLAAYTYLGKTHQVVINGQSGQIAGQRPANWRKVFYLGLAALLPALLLLLLPLLPIPASDFVSALSCFGFLSFLAGLAFVVYMIISAAKLDDA